MLPSIYANGIWYVFKRWSPNSEWAEFGRAKDQGTIIFRSRYQLIQMKIIEK